MKKGFTLSELLLALVVIGVITVIAIPRVVGDMNNKSRVTALQKTYTDLASAVKLLLIAERASTLQHSSLCVDNLSYDTTNRVNNSAGKFLLTYMDVKNDCKLDFEECFAPMDKYKNISKESLKFPQIEDGQAYSVELTSGATVAMIPGDEDVGNKAPVKVYIDVNGKASPNIAGRDLFLIYVYYDGFVGDRVSNTSKETCKENLYGSGCFNRLVNENWSMDY